MATQGDRVRKELADGTWLGYECPVCNWRFIGYLPVEEVLAPAVACRTCNNGEQMRCMRNLRVIEHPQIPLQFLSEAIR